MTTRRVRPPGAWASRASSPKPRRPARRGHHRHRPPPFFRHALRRLHGRALRGAAGAQRLPHAAPRGAGGAGAVRIVTLKDAMNEADRDWVTTWRRPRLHHRHPWPDRTPTRPRPTSSRSSATRPGPRSSRSPGRPPVRGGGLRGRGSTPWGFSRPSSLSALVRLIGVEAAGHGLDTGKHGAAPRGGRGCCTGRRATSCRTATGRSWRPTPSAPGSTTRARAGLSWLKDQGRLELRQATDDEALDVLGYLARTEERSRRWRRRTPSPRRGTWPGWAGVADGGRVRAGQGHRPCKTGRWTLNRSGPSPGHDGDPREARRDQTPQAPCESHPEVPLTPAPDRIADAFGAASDCGTAALVTYVMAGDPDRHLPRHGARLRRRRRRHLYIGMPF